ncbi:4a-hydroxytetrahydrobiopterin dehydratase [Nocardioides mesophilus]|uniref:Putative pterin-4-alpha-carbinolamine dehydratase n=1 Tax=Nocardioides mesophilus TaxID=433659 RepID=A0A7G9RG07_9ACTN|nr:4a-hydroxytetrahydrobiopterin dehydratase [Nocardioides mesophilus]QNN54532.1 4a-hydroxytetrahydrobiopterin dehydratase [Nocardioides mesophilus]
MVLLNNHDVTTALSGLDGWTRDGDTLVRSVEAPTYLDGIALVQRVAEAAERVAHHPDIDVRWRTVTFRLTTHAEGGLTERDLELARVIDSMVVGR